MTLPVLATAAAATAVAIAPAVANAARFDQYAQGVKRRNTATAAAVQRIADACPVDARARCGSCPIRTLCPYASVPARVD